MALDTTRRRSSQASISPASIARALVVRRIGDRTAVRQPVEVDEMAEAKRLSVGELQHQRATLRMADHRRRARRVTDSMTALASRQVRLPRVQLGVLDCRRGRAGPS